jgi:DNA-binding XRE family transcriptional regulator
MPAVLEEKSTIAAMALDYRERNNLSKKQLADILHCSRKTIYSIEQGEVGPESLNVLNLMNLIEQEAQKPQPVAAQPELEQAVQPPEPELEEEDAGDAPEVPEAVSGWLRRAYNDQPGPPITLCNAVLDDTRDRPSFRGNPDINSIQGLRIAPYQRGLLGRRVMEGYVEYYNSGDTMPELTLGMRGHDYQYDEKTRTLTLFNPVFLIDGFQRVGGALYAAESGGNPYLSARIYLDTDEAWERTKFSKLDTLQVKISPNISIRNRQDEVPFIKMLFELTFDPRFALCRRVQWGQHMKRDELSSAYGQLRILSRLFAHIHPELHLQNSGHREMADRLQKSMQKMGRKVMRENIIYYWQIVDEAFGIRDITNKGGSLQAGQAFNSALARVFSAHKEFWRGTELKVPTELKKKLATFPIKRNEDIRALAQASIDGASNDRLALYFVDCLNRRRPKSKRLAPLPAAAAVFHQFYITGGTMK